MFRDRYAGILMFVFAVAILLFSAASLYTFLPNRFLSGLASLSLAVVTAVLILRDDGSPHIGFLMFTAAMVGLAVELWGGATGFAAILYPLLFVWLNRESVGGPVAVIAVVLTFVEFLSPLVEASGLKEGVFDLGAFLEVLVQAFTAGAIPLVSMAAIELLKDPRRDRMPFARRDSGTANAAEAAEFPENIARSLVPILKSGTEAHGVFLFVMDTPDTWTLNEYVADSGSISTRYVVASDEPLIEVLNTSQESIVQSPVSRFALGGSRGLPWYVREERETSWAAVLQFRMGDVPSGFVVLDFESEEKLLSASAMLEHAAFLFAVSWENSRTQKNGNEFSGYCEQMKAAVGIREAVHRLVGGIEAAFPETTVTVAIPGETGALRIFESIGDFSEGRAGREYDLTEGIAGLAVIRKQPVRRLKMGAVRTFSAADDPDGAVGSCCAVPVEDRGGILGVITVESAVEQNFSHDDLLTLKAFSAVFSLTLSRNQLAGEIDRLKQRDSITGLPILSVFHEHMADLVLAVRNSALPITVLAIEIHNFAGINAEFGYRTGDVILQKTGERLQKVFGGRTLVSRNGSAGFLVCLEDVDRVSAEAYAARVHEEFSYRLFAVSGNEIGIGVRIGGASSHVDGMIRRLPDIAVNTVNSISTRQGFSVIQEVGQFFNEA